jgi:hypothetical protein
LPKKGGKSGAAKSRQRKQKRSRAIPRFLLTIVANKECLFGGRLATNL